MSPPLETISAKIGTRFVFSIAAAIESRFSETVATRLWGRVEIFEYFPSSVFYMLRIYTHVFICIYIDIHTHTYIYMYKEKILIHNLLWPEAVRLHPSHI